jgi:hypothetical protein
VLVRGESHNLSRWESKRKRGSSLLLRKLYQLRIRVCKVSSYPDTEFLKKSTDPSILFYFRKSNQEKQVEQSVKQKKASEEAPRHIDQAPTALFFQYNTQLGPPYHVLVDTNFINFR